jgi:hypothetical protein
MSRTRRTAAAAAATAAAAIAILTGCATTHHTPAAAAHTTTTTIATRQAADLHDIAALHQGATTTTAATTAAATTTAIAATTAAATTTATTTAVTTATDPSVRWLESAGGQAQVTFNTEVATLAGDLQTEAHAPTVANHLIFEADARTLRTQAEAILAAPALQPATGHAAYQHMLHQFITLAGLLQPGAGYGTTPQDYTAWYAALSTTNITVS